MTLNGVRAGILRYLTEIGYGSFGGHLRRSIVEVRPEILYRLPI